MAVILQHNITFVWIIVQEITALCVWYQMLDFKQLITRKWKVKDQPRQAITSCTRGLKVGLGPCAKSRAKSVFFFHRADWNNILFIFNYVSGFGWNRSPSPASLATKGCFMIWISIRWFGFGQDWSGKLGGVVWVVCGWCVWGGKGMDFVLFLTQFKCIDLRAQ